MNNNEGRRGRKQKYRATEGNISKEEGKHDKKVKILSHERNLIRRTWECQRLSRVSVVLRTLLENGEEGDGEAGANVRMLEDKMRGKTS